MPSQSLGVRRRSLRRSAMAVADRTLEASATSIATERYSTLMPTVRRRGTERRPGHLWGRYVFVRHGHGIRRRWSKGGHLYVGLGHGFTIRARVCMRFGGPPLYELARKISSHHAGGPDGLITVVGVVAIDTGLARQCRPVARIGGSCRRFASRPNVFPFAAAEPALAI